MPDHIHLFVRGSNDFLLTQWTRILKRNLSKAIAIAPPHWQKGFFDPVLRSEESYSEKWLYVVENPVRTGLVARAEDWPFQGEVYPLGARGHV